MRWLKVTRSDSGPAARPLCRVAGGALLGLGLLCSPANAQVASPACVAGQKIFIERADLIKRAQSFGGKKKIDPRNACTVFTQLTANGTKALKFIEAEGAWCQIPEQVGEQIKNDQPNISRVRGQACGALAKMAQQQRQAQRQAQQQQQGGGGNGLMGGGDAVVGGPVRVPQGAL